MYKLKFFTYEHAIIKAFNCVKDLLTEQFPADGRHYDSKTIL